MDAWGGRYGGCFLPCWCSNDVSSVLAPVMTDSLTMVPSSSKSLKTLWADGCGTESMKDLTNERGDWASRDTHQRKGSIQEWKMGDDQESHMCWPQESHKFGQHEGLNEVKNTEGCAMFVPKKQMPKQVNNSFMWFKIANRILSIPDIRKR